MTSIALDSGGICSGGCAFGSENRVVAVKSTLSSFKLLQKNDRRDPLNPGHALSATGFSYTIFHSHTNTSDDESEIEFTTFSGPAKDSNVYCIYIYIYVYMCSIYGQFVWDLIIARILFRPRISLGTGLAVPIVSHNTASSLYILSSAHGNVYGYIYIYSCALSRNVSAVRLSRRKSPLWLEKPVDTYTCVYTY